MVDQPKTDYPPLIPEPGLHLHSMDQLQVLAVDSFPESKRRRALFNALTVYVDLLECTGLKAHLWIDGSFVCSKEDPDDIDLVVVYDADHLDALSESAVDVISGHLDTHHAKARFGLHVFNTASHDDEALTYWMNLFGTQRDQVTPKGLVELRMNHD